VMDINTIQKLNVVVISDSLGFPRPLEGVQPQHTYVNLISDALRKKDGFAFHLGLGGGSIWDIWKLVEANAGYLKGTNTVFVYHLGIVDSTPRPFLPHEVSQLDKLAGVPGVFKGFIHDQYNVIIKKRGPRFVTETGPFEETLKVMMAHVSQISSLPQIFIPILPCRGRMELQLPDFNNDHREKYNSIIVKISERFRAVFMKDILQTDFSDFFLSDGYHLNQHGHLQVASHLLSEHNLILSHSPNR
jgi:hypothetical protein